jgi:hypothetical protein
MCEYCGCHTVPAIAQLTAEHDEIRAAARSVHRAARRSDFTAARGAVRHLLDLLEPHTAIEERGLFPPMSREFPEHIASLEKDHRRIQVVLAGLAVAETAHDGWEAELARTVGVLFRHILREQDGVFPASLSVLVPAEWDALDAARHAVAHETLEAAR